MYLKLMEPNISKVFYDETEKYLYDLKNEPNPTLILNEINKEIKNIEEIEHMILHRQKYSDEEFVSTMLRIFNILFTQKNILEILSKAYQCNYVEYYYICTDMVQKFYENETYVNKICELLVVCKENFVPDDHLYTILEIKELIANKDIIVVGEVFTEVTNLEFPWEHYQKIPTVNIYNLKDNPEEIKKVANSYVRKRIPSNLIMEELDNYKTNLAKEIKDILSINNKLYYEEKYVRACRRTLAKSKQMSTLKSYMK